MTIPAVTTRPTSAAELRARVDPASPPGDGFEWSRGLALPAYSYGAISGVLSSASAYADSHPAGGIVINPGGIHRHPEWTRHLADHTLLRQAQPILAGVAAGLHLVRAGVTLREAWLENDNRKVIAGSLDILLAATSAVAITSPGVGGAASLALLGARAVLEAH